MISFEFRKTQNGSMFNMKYNNYSKRETIIRDN